MIVLDTNVISEINRPKPSSHVLDWFARSDANDLFLSDITIMELAYGAEKHRLKTDSNRYYPVLHRLTRDQFQNRILRWVPNANILAGYARARSRCDDRRDLPFPRCGAGNAQCQGFRRA